MDWSNLVKNGSVVRIHFKWFNFRYLLLSSEMAAVPEYFNRTTYKSDALNFHMCLFDSLEMPNRYSSSCPKGSFNMSSVTLPVSLSSPPCGSTAYQFLHRSINPKVANRVAKTDVNLALSPTFRYVFTESPL
ncbi:hypothetical protein TNCV_1966821 [Trichonephila clavipes]|nr:hypothetical protein TNCV_1966821 [Trichonephila clavipes]